MLFIQGVGVHGDGWLPQIAQLSATYRCVSFDNRGMGRSLPAAAAITVEQMAADAEAVLQAVQVERAHVVSHSLGGLVALQLALGSRRCVASLALLCTFASGGAAAPLSARMIWLGFRSRVGTRRMRREGFRRLVLPPGIERGPEVSNDRLAALFGHDLADQPPVVSAQLRAMRRAGKTAALGTLAGVPTIVASAVHDPIAPASAGRALAASIPGAEYVEFDNASHGLPITHAREVNALLSRHLLAAQAAGAAI